MTWEVASRADDLSADTLQPKWDGPNPYGVVYAAPVAVVGLFRSQQRWAAPARQGEFMHGEASCTFPRNVRPAYTDSRVRDRFTIVNATGDAAAGKVFYPAGQATPFIFDGETLGWRVVLQSLDQEQRLVPE
jgi:hypothetical protein